MALTQAEFLAVANLNPTTLNIWYDDSTQEILGITVPLQDTNIPPQNALQYLLEIESITIPVGVGGPTVIITVQDKSLLGTPLDQYYFLKPPTPFYIGTIINPTLQLPESTVNFSPNTPGVFFVNGEYNAILNNIDTNRDSTSIFDSTGISFAKVQDSLYSDTGWIKARYEGSQTQAQGFSGISPIITGQEFKGTYYPSNIQNNLIRSQSSSDRVSVNYLHTGEEQLPNYELIDTGWELLEEVSLGESTEIAVSPSISQNISPGDLLRIKIPPFYISSEVIKVLDVYEKFSVKQIDIIRGWGQTVQESYTSDGVLIKISPTTIFELEGNRINKIRSGKIYIQETSEILTVDDLGMVITGSLV